QINATGTPSITTALLGNGTWGTPTGAGDMQKTVEGLAIGQSTATLRTDFTAEVTSRTVGVWTNENVRVGTATLSYFAVNLPTATYSGVKVGTATIALGVAAANVQAGSLGSSVIASSIAVSAVGIPQINATGTPSITTALLGNGTWGTPTGAGDMQKTVEGLAIGQSTQTLRTDITSLQQSTGTLKLQFVDVGVSTGTLRTDFAAEVNSRTTGIWTNENVRVGTATISLGVAAENVQAGSLPGTVIASSIAVSAVGVQQMNATGTPSAIKFLRGDNQWMEATTLTLKGVLPTDVPAGYIFYLTTDDNVYIAATDIVAGFGTWRKVATAIVP
ncbi:MAG: hypothetical protein WCG51_01300, partial [Elusimicrobiota bacterium]